MNEPAAVRAAVEQERRLGNIEHRLDAILGTLEGIREHLGVLNGRTARVEDRTLGLVEVNHDREVVSEEKRKWLSRFLDTADKLLVRVGPIGAAGAVLWSVLR